MPSGVALTTDSSFDLWKTTLEAWDWDNKSIEYLLDKHQYVVVDQWFREDRIEQEGGTQIIRDVIYREDGEAAFVLPGEVRTRSTMNVIAQITMPFCLMPKQHTITEFEINANRGREQLKKLSTAKRQVALKSIADTLESRVWQLPDVTNNKKPRGVPYWIVPITSSQRTAHGVAGTKTGALQGENPSGFSDCGGIDASDDTKTRWRNWNDTWTNSAADMTEEDLVRIGRMHRHMRFQAPITVADIDKRSFQKTRIYACEDVIDNFSKVTRAQNDQLGSDAGKYLGAGVTQTGVPTFRGLPLIWIEQLDGDTTLPFVMLNHDKFYPVVRQGVWLREGSPMRTVDQPDTFTTWIDNEFNILCLNRAEGGGMISYPA